MFSKHKPKGGNLDQKLKIKKNYNLIRQKIYT
jgi:hypothetical protein